MLSTLAVLGLGLLPSVVWLIFYLQEDRKHPEPLWLVVYAFVVGGIMTFFALVLQMLTRGYFTSIGVAQHSFLEISTFSIIEEVLKFLAVYWFISRRDEFDEPLDAMIYMITVALGFAAVENIASIGQGNGLGLGLSGIAPLEILAFRFFGATVLHSVASGIMGYHWALALDRGSKVGLFITIGLAVAILLHAVFNYLILINGPGGWAITFALFIGFFLISDFEALKRTDF